MTELQTFRERLHFFIKEHLMISMSQFEKKCGLSNGIISKVSYELHPKSLAKIKRTYPKLSVDWLRTGKGDMLECDCTNSINVSNSTIRDNSANINNELLDEIRMIRKEHQDEIKRLLDIQQQLLDIINNLSSK